MQSRQNVLINTHTHTHPHTPTHTHTHTHTHVSRTHVHTKPSRKTSRDCRARCDTHRPPPPQVPSVDEAVASVFLPDACAAFVLLFPCTANIYRFRREEELRTRALARDCPALLSPQIFFLKQVGAVRRVRGTRHTHTCVTFTVNIESHVIGSPTHARPGRRCPSFLTAVGTHINTIRRSRASGMPAGQSRRYCHYSYHHR